MKYTTIIMQTITAGALVMGLAAQATAANATQVRFEVGSPALGGTQEGVHEYRVAAEDNRSSEHYTAGHYRTTFEVGSPALGGTREGVHRQRIEVESLDRDVAQSERAGPSVDNPTQGTRG